jgi:hypothetical protein
VIELTLSAFFGLVMLAAFAGAVLTVGVIEVVRLWSDGHRYCPRRRLILRLGPALTAEDRAFLERIERQGM